MSRQSPSRVEIHIDRLILDGVEFDSHDSNQLSAAVRLELASRIAADGLPSAWMRGGSIDELAAGQIAPTRSAQALGASIASAVHQGFVQ